MLGKFGVMIAYDNLAREARVFGLPHQKHLNDYAVDDIYTALDHFGLRPLACPL